MGNHGTICYRCFFCPAMFDFRRVLGLITQEVYRSSTWYPGHNRPFLAHYRIAIARCHESHPKLMTLGDFWAGLPSSKVVSPSEATFLDPGRSYQPPIVASPCFTVISPRKNTPFGWFETLQGNHGNLGVSRPFGSFLPMKSMSNCHGSCLKSGAKAPRWHPPTMRSSLGTVVTALCVAACVAACPDHLVNRTRCNPVNDIVGLEAETCVAGMNMGRVKMIADWLFMFWYPSFIHNLFG